MKNKYIIITIAIFAIVTLNLFCKKSVNKEIWWQTTHCYYSASYGSINLFTFEDDSIFINTFLELYTSGFNNWDSTLSDTRKEQNIKDSTKIQDFELFKSGIYKANDKELIISIDTKSDTFEITDWNSSHLKLSGLLKL